MVEFTTQLRQINYVKLLKHNDVQQRFNIKSVMTLA